MSKRLSFAVFGIVALALILISGVSLARTPPVPRPNSTPAPPPPNWEEEQKALEAIKRRIALTPTPRRISEITRGSLIRLGGTEVQLPENAYVEGVIGSADCPVGIPCPKPPILLIRRGNSRAAVEEKTGRITNIEYAPGEEHIFDFLLEALP